MARSSDELSIESIRQTLTNRTHWLTLEEAIAYVCYKIIQRRTYPSRLIVDCPMPYRISDTICYKAIAWLLEERILNSRIEKLEEGKRGRPRRMLDIAVGNRGKAEELAQLWETCLKEKKLT